MKVIRNNDIALSLNKGRLDLLFESIDDLCLVYKLPVDVILSLRNNEKSPGFVGYVKCYSFEDGIELDFIPVYMSEDFDVVHHKVVYRPQDRLLMVSNQGDYFPLEYF